MCSNSIGCSRGALVPVCLVLKVLRYVRRNSSLSYLYLSDLFFQMLSGSVREFSGIATVLSFGSTYAKQLGYSKITVGYIMMCLFILSMLTKPIVGAVVDKFHIKKRIFLAFIFFTGMSAFLLMFVPELPLEYSTELDCNATTTVKIFTENTKRLSYCDQIRLTRNNDEGMIKCQV